MKISEEKLKELGYKLVDASDCKIENAGKTDDYVYDLEVSDGSHMFFANDILVHNSIYVRMDNVLKILFKTTDINWDDPETFKKIKTFVDDKFQKVLNQHVADYICERFHTSERRIEFKREKISSEGDYLCKKRYVVHVRDNEGVECDKFSYTGVDIAKNELPQKIKDLLKNLVENMMRNKWRGNEHIQPEIMKIYEEYASFSIDDIGFIKNLSTPKEATGFLTMEKGAGVHARAAEAYNQLIEHLKITNKHDKINKGDRFHYIYVKSSNKYGLDSIAWKDRYPKEFSEIFEVDIDTMFDKTVVSPLKKFLECHNATYFDPNNIVIPGEDGKSLFDL